MRPGYIRLLFSVLVISFVTSSLQSCRLPVKEKPDLPVNIILIIGDGMGYPHIEAASMYISGRKDSFPFHGFPAAASVKTSSASSAITDSAAASTAMATGRKVRNGVISLKKPGTGKPLTTLLQLSKAEGRLTGLVTNTHLTHATPAAFAAHAENRSEYDRIADDYLNKSRPDIMLGGGGYGLDREKAEAAGYIVMENSHEMYSVLDDPAAFEQKKAGLFGNGHMPYMAEDNFSGEFPYLSAMAEAALGYLENGENGFFLMIESGRIDHAAHNNNLEYVIPEILELSETVKVIMEWAEGRNDTLVVLTADHETGGLVLKGKSGKNEVPDHRWRTKGHSAAEVPLYAWGYMSEGFNRPVIDNTDIFKIITGEIISEPSDAGRFLIEYNFKFTGWINSFK